MDRRHLRETGARVTPSAALTPITAAVFVLTRVTEQTWSLGAPTVQGSQHEQLGTHALRAWSTCRRGPARRRTRPYDAEASNTAPTARLVTRLLVLEDPGGGHSPGVPAREKTQPLSNTPNATKAASNRTIRGFKNDRLRRVWSRCR